MNGLKTLDLKFPDRRIAEETKELLCAVKWVENRKANHASVVSIARKADIYLEAVNEGKRSFLAGFSKSKDQARLAMAVLEEMRIASWKYVLFAGGRVQIKKFGFLNMLDCAGTAARLRTPERHCHKIFDQPRSHFIDDGRLTIKITGDDEPEEPEAWLIPCRELEGHFQLSTHEFDDPRVRLEIMEAAAERRQLTSCPFFDLSSFRTISNKAKVTAPKRYW